MQIHLLRHAEAAPAEAGASARDEDRPLTEKGRRQAQLAGRALRKMGVAIDLFLASPLARAVETARLAAEELDLTDRIVEDEAVAGGDFAKLYLAIDRCQPVKSVCLVGHEPTFGCLLGELLQPGQSLCIPMKKAGLALIEVDRLPPQGAGMLRWLLTGEQVCLLSEQDCQTS